MSNKQSALEKVNRRKAEKFAAGCLDDLCIELSGNATDTPLLYTLADFMPSRLGSRDDRIEAAAGIVRKLAAERIARDAISRRSISCPRCGASYNRHLADHASIVLFDACLDCKLDLGEVSKGMADQLLTVREVFARLRDSER